jgi:hypothetical protein
MVPFLDSLRVELAGRTLLCCTLVEPGAAPASGPSVRVSVEIDPCVPDGERVRVSVQGLANGEAVEREVSLSDVPPGVRPRALALAVAELIRPLGQPAPPDPAPDVWPPPEAPPPVLPPPAEAPAPSGFAIGIEGEARALPTRDTTMWGGRLRVTVPWRSLHADFDLGADFASTHPALGDVLMRSSTVGLGLGPRLANRSAVLDLGVRAELGWAWIVGETPQSGVRTQNGSQAIISAGLRAAIELPARSWARPHVSVEGGAVLLGLNGEASKRPVVGMTGYYLLAAVGMAVSP